MEYTVGQLAKLSGVTVRALHHYEKLGLLPPSGRSQAGYRRYCERDVLRLHRILACRQTGVQLKEIARYLGPNAPPLRALLTRQAATVEAEIDRLQRLLSMLNRLTAISETIDEPNLSTHLLDLMNAMQSLERHYTADELKQLHSLRDALAPQDRLEMKVEIAVLLQAFGTAESNGIDPADAEVKGLARRWMALGAMASASQEVVMKTRMLIESNVQVQHATGITPSLKTYIDRALAAAKKNVDLE